MKAILYMVISVDGFIADVNGNEDFLSESGWDTFKVDLKKYKHVIWGRKTLEAVTKWGKEYLEDLSKYEVIVITNNKNYKTKFSFVKVCHSIEESLLYCKEKNYKPYVSGGQTMVSEFLNKDFVSDIYLQVSPVVIGKGIKLFNESINETTLKFISAKKFKETCVLHYKIEEKANG